MKFSRNFKLPFKGGYRKVHYRWDRRLRYHYNLAPLFLVVMVSAGVVIAAHLQFNFTTPPTTPTSPKDSLAQSLKAKHWLPIQIATPHGSTTVRGNSAPIGDVAALTHGGITTTVFWAGEPSDSSNGYIANSASAWDGNWQQHYGGVDADQPRNGYLPAGFTPKENPFYFALPYSDITDGGQRKSSANNCPNSSVSGLGAFSWCKNSWIAIRHGSKVAYAQWEDVGPFESDDVSYVFGNRPPRNTHGAKAGLDVSPAVRDYLGLQDVDHCDWAFIAASSVPAGPWSQIITTSKGDAI